MFSLHIDTAVGWRGGQSLVLHTVLGLRALGQRAALVAHPDGELLRRLSEGHDLVPLAPRGEVDLSAAWRLSRVLKQLAPNIVHAYDPHAVAMASTVLSIVAPSPKPPLLTSVRTAAHLAHSSFARWKHSQIDCFIANSRFVRTRLSSATSPPCHQTRDTTTSSTLRRWSSAARHPEGSRLPTRYRRTARR